VDSTSADPGRTGRLVSVISLRCTVIDALRPPASSDLDVHAEPGTALSDVAPRLLAACGLPADRELSVRGRRLPAEQPLGVPPLVDGVLLVALPPRSASTTDVRQEPPPARTSAVLRLCVVAGPDSGHSVPLRPGTHTVGRGPDVAVSVQDPAMSRRHLSLTLGPDGALLHDLASTNGTRVGSLPVTAAGVQLLVGQRFAAGDSTMVVRVDDHPPASIRPDGHGGIGVNRAPRELAVVRPVRIARPVPPPEEPPGRFPWVTILVPLVLCVPVALLMHQPTYLAFGLVGPLAMVVTALVERRTRGRRRADAAVQWQARDEAATATAAAALAAELELRRRRAVDAEKVAATVSGPTRSLWERSDGDSDLLEISLGSAGCRSAVCVTGGATEVASEDGRQWLPDAPFTLLLDEVTHLGLSGDAARVRASARYVLGQVAACCTPRDVRVVVLSSDAQEWSWTRWLPHVLPLGRGDLEVEVERRSARSAGAGALSGPSQPRLVVLLDLLTEQGQPSNTSARALAATLRDGPDVGVHVVALAGSAADLPSCCGVSIDVAARGPSRVHRREGHGTGSGGSQEPGDLMLDGVSQAWAEDLARALAPLRDTTPEPGGAAALPVAVALSGLLDVDPGNPGALVERWRSTPRSTRISLGSGIDGPAVVDLVRDGPHALVAGTTGSGKSELLLTLVTSLAVGNRPDELCFVLVDYKGGAAFQRCADLPHVVGLVTDLDGHLAARALSALQAELTRRERLLAGAAAANLTEYQRHTNDAPHLPRLARLVLVIDEFRLLAKELPDFLDGLVRLAAVGRSLGVHLVLAAVGRSLGVHLVLATQRPAGIVSADIRSNVNLRICLRVRDRVDSEDVLDAPDAAALADAHPGRGLLCSGSGTLLPFQAALAGGAPVELRPRGVLVLPAGQPVPVDERPDELAALARSLHAASTRVGAQPPPSPWLPPLPDLLPFEGLAGRSRPGGDRSKPPSPGVLLGLADHPGLGRQDLVRWDPAAASHLGISGAPRSGRTSALLTVLRGLLDGESGRAVHVHVVDAAGGALAAALAPAVQSGRRELGTVLTGDQPLAVRRLVSALTQRLREPATSASHTGTVLVVDGWEPLAESLEKVDHGRGLDDLLTLVRDGEQAGLRLVVAGGRGVLLSRLASLVGERLLLRPTDPTDLLLAGVPTATSTLRQPPGRAIHLPAGHEVQLAWPGDAEQLRHALARSPDDIAPCQEAPLRLQPLPARVTVRQLAHVPAEQLAVVLGVGGDEALPAVLDLGLHRRVLVSGPGGSGRSQTLATIARQLHGRGQPVVAVASCDSPLLAGPWLSIGLDQLDAGTAASPRELGDLRALGPDGCLLLDDVEDLAHHHGLAIAVDELCAGRAGPALVWAARRDGLRGPSSTLTASAHRHRTGVLLQPRTMHDGEPLGVLAGPADLCVPGRGLLVLRGKVAPLQVAS
jgi:S-DNA-T family DNA segregation ATPase FtsK/SpoIIIE